MRKGKVVSAAASLAGTLLVALLTIASANVPPPPANQFLGIYDTVFGSLTRLKCLECHGNDSLLIQRHHALLNNVSPAKTYECLTCHTLIPDGTGGFTFADFRTCENCHTTSPHHITPAAQERHCNACHGSFVDNYDTGTTYQPIRNLRSLQTPTERRIPTPAPVSRRLPADAPHATRAPTGQ